jgi:uncharacterized protein YjbJ (UPF0337 family)
MNKDRVQGKVEEFKGRAKQAVAHATDDPALHDEGKADEIAGKTQAGVGKAKEKIGRAIENVGKALKK